VAGAITLSLIPILIVLAYHLYNALLHRETRPINVAFCCAGTVTFGGLLGAVAGAGYALSGLGHFKAAGWTCLAGGGAIALLWVSLSWVMKDDTEGSRIWGFLLWLVHPWFGAPLLWGLALMIWGSRMLGR
jgi:hypothetical protein